MLGHRRVYTQRWILHFSRLINSNTFRRNKLIIWRSQLFFCFFITVTFIKRQLCTFLRTVIATNLIVMYQSIPKPPIPPAQSPGIWLALSSVRGEFDPKWGPPGGAFVFHVKTSVSGRKQKDFAILWFSRWATFTGHCSCQFHVGFSVVLVLYSPIVEYAFV